MTESNSAHPVIVWFRQDLRLADNPALSCAVKSGQPILPVYVLDDESPGDWKPGGASRWWLHKSLEALAASLDEAGAALHLVSGRGDKAILDLVDEVGASAVYWNRCYEPWSQTRDAALKSELRARGLEARSFNGSLLNEPWTVKTKSGGPMKVFTPFWKAAQKLGEPDAPLPAPDSIDGFKNAPGGDDLDDWGLLPSKPDWAGGLRETWTPGESGALDRLDEFLDARLRLYKSHRDHPDTEATSGLSPHLHFGEVSPRQVWHATQRAVAHGADQSIADKFLSEIGWREFSYNLIHHFPALPHDNLQSKFDRFPWNDDEDGYRAWTKGLTGYPLVDAGMRELWRTGWMHNRVRMVAASFLIKHLRIDWRRGEAWFWDTLVDADLANNSASWQWVAGSGADAAPYFRIFNPFGQGEKFDAGGAYVRRWIPEIAALPDKYIHQPWTAPREVLDCAGVTLGRTYPKPIVDHKQAREAALAAFESIKETA